MTHQNSNILVTDEYFFFWGGMFSNHYSSLFTVNGVEYSCGEQYMMAGKATLFNDSAAREKIMATKDPIAQKRLGRTVRDFDKERWDAVAKDVVYEGCLAKFSQNLDFKQYMMDSGDRILVEASPYDAIWGIKMSTSDPDILNPAKWRGTNWLGEVLMKVRETLKKEENIGKKT